MITYEEYVKLMTERLLLTRLIRLDKDRYRHLQARVTFIKVYINSCY